MDKKIIVTGGAGYIGSHTCVALADAGYEPVIVDDFSNSEKWIIPRIEALAGGKITVLEGDCRDETFLYESLKNIEGICGVIHFAAFKAVGESEQKPLAYYQNNLGATTSLLAVMKTLEINVLIFSSSCTVYGQPDTLPVSETAPIKPAQSVYGHTKQICEDIICACTSEATLHAIALRYFNPIGAHPSAKIGELPLGTPNNLIPFLTQTVAGKRDKLTVFGDDYNTPDGTCIRDYIHVVDLAKAHVAAIQKLEDKSSRAFDAINIGTGTGSSVMEVIRTFEIATGEKVPYTIGNRRDGDVEQVYADARKAKEVLGWKAQYSLAEALQHAWTWEEQLMR